MSGHDDVDSSAVPDFLAASLVGRSHRLLRNKLLPDRIVAQGRDKGLMSGQFIKRDPRRERYCALPPRRIRVDGILERRGVGTSDQLRLPRARSGRYRLPPAISASSSAPCLVRRELSMRIARRTDRPAGSSTPRMLAPRQQQRINQPDRAAPAASLHLARVRH